MIPTIFDSIHPFYEAAERILHAMQKDMTLPSPGPGIRMQCQSHAGMKRDARSPSGKDGESASRIEQNLKHDPNKI